VLISQKDYSVIGKAFKKSPVALVKKMINKKYTFTILIHLWLLKQNRFGELNTIKTINSKTLTFTLRDMVENELIRKKVYQKSPRVTKYFITKKGKALVRVYIHMINFAIEHYSKQVLVDEKLKKFEDLLSKKILKLIQKES